MTVYPRKHISVWTSRRNNRLLEYNHCNVYMASIAALILVLITMCMLAALSIVHIESFSNRCDALTGFVDSLDGKSIPNNEKRKHKIKNPLFSKVPHHGKVVGGYDDAHNEYVCQGFVNGGAVPGRSWSGHDYCTVGVGGGETKATNFNYLDSNQGLYWSKFPSKKINGGKLNGVDQQICRAKIGSGLFIGRTWPGHNSCNIGYHNQERTVADYEYLSQPASINEQPAHMLTIPKVDNIGNDLSDTGVIDGKACKTLCQTTPACHLASYSTSSNHCWLKKDFTPNTLKSNPDISTYAKVSRQPVGQKVADTDYPGNDISAVPVASSDDCAALCASISDCKASGWDSSGGNTCWLKSVKGSAVNNASRQSWLK